MMIRSDSFCEYSCGLNSAILNDLEPKNYYDI